MPRNQMKTFKEQCSWKSASWQGSHSLIGPDFCQPQIVPCIASCCDPAVDHPVTSIVSTEDAAQILKVHDSLKLSVTN